MSGPSLWLGAAHRVRAGARRHMLGLRRRARARARHAMRGPSAKRIAVRNERRGRLVAPPSRATVPQWWPLQCCAAEARRLYVGGHRGACLPTVRPEHRSARCVRYRRRRRATLRVRWACEYRRARRRRRPRAALTFVDAAAHDHSRFTAWPARRRVDTACAWRRVRLGGIADDAGAGTVPRTPPRARALLGASRADLPRWRLARTRAAVATAARSDRGGGCCGVAAGARVRHSRGEGAPRRT